MALDAHTPRRATRVLTFVIATVVGVTALGAGAPPSHVAGRVVRPGGDSVVAVSNTWVTLHRVGTDHAGPLDSTRTGANGSYAFDYARTGAEDAIYFVSSSYGGVAYFTPPLQAGSITGDDAEITVFDTTSHAVPMSMRGRHLVVQRPGADGARVITEVFELSNDSSVTRVARGDDASGAVWTSALPSGAKSPAVTEGDIPAQAVRFTDGRSLLFAPMPPGIRQLSYHYALGSGDFPLALPVQRATQVLEVLVEERDAQVSGAKLREVAPVALSGREFRRFLASDVPASAVITVRVNSPDRPLTLWFAAGLTVAIGGVMTWTLARALRRR